MGHGDDGTFILPQVFFQPQHTFCVEVVGRFIQQQYVGLAQQQAAKRHAAFFAAREGSHRGIRRGTAQGIHGYLEAVVQIPGIQVVELFLNFTLTFKQFVEIRVGIAEGFVDLVKFFE